MRINQEMINLHEAKCYALDVIGIRKLSYTLQIPIWFDGHFFFEPSKIFNINDIIMFISPNSTFMDFAFFWKFIPIKIDEVKK